MDSSSISKNLPAMKEILVQFLCQENPVEKEMATHSSILVRELHGQEAWCVADHGIEKSWT